MSGYIMQIVKHFATCWRNTKEMPFLLRMLCQGAMVVAPAFLILLTLPLLEWEIDGHRMSYAELWSSGQGTAIAASLVLVSVGAWGLAARKRSSRWLLALSPVVPYFILAIFPGAPTVSSEPIAIEIIVSATVAAIVVYVCLFHSRAVCEYLDGESVDT
ncbi:MAG TPA: hypothetical protein VGQ08_10320 [Nitrospiraceae bacterium]|nr:hypothetical protein [Nitrospiraceae bacterium]